ncbi:hypothetical protein [Devosia sp. SL43]|uniref:hypothetical protein n=1 Tax=Devosia sp. SL43 TaxID=2806348 RepID=UPI001F2AC07A|nr:hypothetical protein [Devosia sp. SL43]UJW83950.1 hypothetical protein IM737_10780 [Devosia sp. SL43]
MEENPAVPSERKIVIEARDTKQAAAPAQPERPARRLPWTSILSFVVGLVGVAALGATAWVYTETQREIVRMSTDIAQIRLSLELYGQRATGAARTAPGADGLLDLSNRLAILEQSWRGATPTNPAPASVLPALPGETAPATGAVATGGDCLPTGTRFMVSAGDSYAVCGTTGSVAIAGVDDGFITLGDGTVIAQGGTVGLPGTQCMVGLMPSDGGGISGFAEIRVTC